MKRKEFKSKLTLNKKTIANLENTSLNEMNQIKGGTGTGIHCDTLDFNDKSRCVCDKKPAER